MARSGRFQQRVGKGAGAAGGKRKGSQLPEVVRERLKAARQQLDTGDFAGASTAFAGLAEKAHERGRHRMALRMGLFAARAAARGGDRDGALDQVLRAARYAAPIQDQTRVGRRFGSLVARLRAGGHEEDADAVEAAAMEALGLSRLPAPGEGARTVNRNRRRMLPKTCGTCGAPVDLDEVEFDEDGADCPECGAELVR